MRISIINEFSSIVNPLRNIDKTSVTCDILSILTQQFDTKFKIVLQQMEKGFKSCIFSEPQPKLEYLCDLAMAVHLLLYRSQTGSKLRQKFTHVRKCKPSEIYLVIDL